MGTSSPRLPFDEPPDAVARRDELARRIATDPRRNVVLEASAGTGKTTVLVNRYLNLIKAGVDPANVLAITFTRKAAAEMRQRIVRELQKAAALSAADAARWHDLRDRLGDIGICTIDAFCLSLLREFPLEAGLDPGFDVADETLVARIKQDALDRTLAVCRRLAAKDDSMRVLLSLLGDSRLRRALDRLLDRRLVAQRVLRRFAPGRAPAVHGACAAVATRIAGVLDALPGGLEAFLHDGPRFAPAFGLVARDLRLVSNRAAAPSPATPRDASDLGTFRAALDSVRDYFVTQGGEPRKRMSARFDRHAFESTADSRRHARDLAQVASAIDEALRAFNGELNRLLASAVRRAFAIAGHQFRRQLSATAALDFSEVLARTLTLLGRMDEFSQSRYRLESRYHHVLVDEFQDTSRAQWRLVSLLVKSWGEGLGLAGDVLPPSIFVVGDRKQSIYGFRDADATILGVARRDIQGLRPARRVRRSISRSFRSAPALLSFANDLFACVAPATRPGGFRYGRRDAFPVGEDEPSGDPCLGLVVGDGIEQCASGVADEIAALLDQRARVRDPRTGLVREVTPGDVAVLFRSREGHQEYERALAARGVPAYVYKGLGFFDADETKDVLALVDYLARPDADLTTAALLRSRLVRLSDGGLQRLAPGIAAALQNASAPDPAARLDAEDRRAFEQARSGVAAWLPLVDRLPPAEVVDRVLEQCAYGYEMRGPRRAQARENLKKMRALIRKIQNRGYATMADVAEHLRVLSAGDESNAVVDALDAVNLMTVHAAKGLEFPVVFLVNLSRGTGGGHDPIRVVRERGVGSVSVGDFTSDADSEAPERELEETKRLLYVAVTRARDRLYFSSPLRKSRFTPHPRSLGFVLPASFAALFKSPSAPGRTLSSWQGASGRAHPIVVCPVADSGQARTPSAVALRREQVRRAGQIQERPIGFGGSLPAAAPSWTTGAFGDAPVVHDAFAPLEAGGPERVAVTAVLSHEPGSSEEEPAATRAGRASSHPDEQPVLGLLVHRVLQYLAPEDATLGSDELLQRVKALLSAGERSTLESPIAGDASSDESEILRRTVDGVLAIASDARVRPLLAGEWLHEVPFSMVSGGRLLRGVIDLLVMQDDRVTVVEVKTGVARPEHARQLDLYRTAAEQLFPGRAVDGIVLYTHR